MDRLEFRILLARYPALATMLDQMGGFFGDVGEWPLDDIIDLQFNMEVEDYHIHTTH
jgi:hypothetical protein